MLGCKKEIRILIRVSKRGRRVPSDAKRCDNNVLFRSHSTFERMPKHKNWVLERKKGKKASYPTFNPSVPTYLDTVFPAKRLNASISRDIVLGGKGHRHTQRHTHAHRHTFKRDGKLMLQVFPKEI